MFDIDKKVAKFTDFVPFENYEDYKKLSSEDKKEYDYRLKIYRDWRNIIQTVHDDDVQKGRKEQKDEGIIRALEVGRISIEVIAQIFKESTDFILKIKEENNL